MDLDIWKKIKKEKKLTYDDIALKSGVSRRTIIRIFSDANSNPTNFNIEAIERALEINQPAILPQGAFEIGNKLIPVVGQVVAGVPVESSEYLESYITVDYPHPQEYFGLRVNGDSMIGARIHPKDILIVHKQSYAENGDIVVASINGESTVKRYKIFGDNVFLMPENSKYEPIPITEKDNFIIFGKVVSIRVDF